MKVLAAMSGGVDSSVAAARMVDAGHEVVGVHMALSTAPGTLRTGSRGCCSKEDAADARRVADVLGIPFYVWDFAEKFKEDVINDFVSSYARGETPNPCVRCNQQIKFAALSARAVALGFDTVATATTPGCRVGGCAAPSTGTRISLMCLPCSLRSSCATPRSRSRHAEAADPCRGGPPRPGGRQQAG